MASRPQLAMAARLLLTAVVAAAAALRCRAAAFQDCSTTNNYTGDSGYKKNLDQLIATLSAGAVDNGWFYSGTVGEAGADQVSGLIMCWLDTTAKKCLDCLSGAANITAHACPGSRSVDVLYDTCVLRYSDTTILGTADLDKTYRQEILVPNASLSSEGVNAAWVSLKSKLKGDLAGSSPLRFVYATAPFMTSQEIYGLAQCTRDLDANECSRCINDYISQVPIYFFKQTENTTNVIGGAVMGYSCYLRYFLRDLEITLPPPTSPSPQPGPSTSSNKTRIVIGVSVIGSISFLIVLGFSMWLLLRRWWRKEAELHEETRAMEDEFEKGSGPQRFRYGELAVATDNFSDKHKLGEGGFGSVYRGFLKQMNLHVAIKRVSKSSNQGRKEYASEVRIISRLRHRNLVQLIGWCHDGGDLLLVYELMPNGSLDTHLYCTTRNQALPWTPRHEILLGLGSALLYLHEECEQCVVHRDIKPSNVMLDASFNAKLGDFGLARFIDHARGSHTTLQAGTLGYMDPSMIRGRASASTQSDVYSFGVVLLEVACGRSPAVVLDDDGAVIHLAWHVAELHGQGRVLAAADPKLNGEFDAREMESVLVAGLWCTQDDRNLRPSIRQALSVLRFDLPLPSLPERPPVATYRPPVGLQNSDLSSQTYSDHQQRDRT